MQLPRLTSSILMLPTLASGIVFNFVQLAQSASLLPPSSKIVEPLSVDLNFNFASGGADQSTAIFAILTQISNPTNKAGISSTRTASFSYAQATSGSDAPVISVSDPQTASAPSTQPRQGFSIQSLFTSLSQIRLAEKGDTLRPIPVLDAIQGTDVNEGIYTFRNSGDSGNAALSGQIGIPNNAIQIVQGGGLFRPGLVGTPLNQLSIANRDVEFNLVPENTLQTSLGTAYQTSLSGAVGDLDSKFSLTIKTELRLLPDPILITASNLELQDFGTSKLTETRKNSLYALQGNLNQKFQETTKYIQKRIEKRERNRYIQRQRNKNPIVSGTISAGANRQFSASTQLPLNSVQSPLNSSLIPISYATPNRTPANFSNPRERAPSRNLLSNPQLSPQPLKTLPGNF